MKKTGKKKISAVDRYLIFCIAFAVIYTICEQTRLWVTGGMEASQLTMGVFAMCTGELFAAVFIYRFKIKRRENNE